jgi:hypothetical protein
MEKQKRMCWRCRGRLTETETGRKEVRAPKAAEEDAQNRKRNQSRIGRYETHRLRDKFVLALLGSGLVQWTLLHSALALYSLTECPTQK